MDFHSSALFDLKNQEKIVTSSGWLQKLHLQGLFKCLLKHQAEPNKWGLHYVNLVNVSYRLWASKRNVILCAHPWDEYYFIIVLQVKKNLDL